jgi:hypothetical protein
MVIGVITRYMDEVRIVKEVTDSVKCVKTMANISPMPVCFHVLMQIEPLTSPQNLTKL